MASLSYQNLKKISGILSALLSWKVSYLSYFTAYHFTDFLSYDYKSAALPLSHTSTKS